MSKGVTFTRDAAERIKRAVLAVERSPIPMPTPPRTKKRQLDAEESTSSGTSLYVAKIKSGTGDTYTADIYSDYQAGTKYATDVTLKIIQIDAGETVPANTLYPCFQLAWSGTTYWTAYAPVLR